MDVKTARDRININFELIISVNRLINLMSLLVVLVVEEIIRCLMFHLLSSKIVLFFPFKERIGFSWHNRNLEKKRIIIEFRSAVSKFLNNVSMSQCNESVTGEFINSNNKNFP